MYLTIQRDVKTEAQTLEALLRAGIYINITTKKIQGIELTSGRL